MQSYRAGLSALLSFELLVLIKMCRPKAYICALAYATGHI